MIKTFIFLDLETTGLIANNRMPKVTEMSLIAVSRTAICETTDIIPRTLQKLVLLLNPGINISEKVEKITGLSNKNLEDVQCFNCEIYNLVNHFINRQKAPICFVAYNGNIFDYPILLSEFKSISKSFSENILSIDMYHLIQQFFLSKKIQSDTVKPTTSSNCPAGDINALLNDSCDQLLSDALDSVMRTRSDEPNKDDLPAHRNEKIVSCSDNTLNIYCKRMQEINEKTPENRLIKPQYYDKNFQKRNTVIARRKLYFTNSSPTNFKLSTVHKHILGTDLDNAHSAEGDCLGMIRCAIQLGNFFVEWADKKAVPLINYTK
ncbi:uncharacterized protein LOC143431322 [Xylocopa sonorina]|uniref:uncharacterized protein LOC143431322 n=1 Tax=Xylocopa sonorina TaxID=1818115 RepID=UPI00403AF60B